MATGQLSPGSIPRLPVRWPYMPVSLFFSSSPQAVSSEKYPRSSPAAPAVPFCTPLIVTRSTSPWDRGSSFPLSGSHTPWPSPANTPLSGSRKVSVPMPAVLSRIHMPQRHFPSLSLRTGVMVFSRVLPPRSTVKVTGFPAPFCKYPVNSSLPVMLCPSTAWMQSPTCSPACRPGSYSSPPLITVDSSTTVTPLVSIRIPKGWPPTSTRGCSTQSAVTVFTGIMPHRLYSTWTDCPFSDETGQSASPLVYRALIPSNGTEMPLSSVILKFSGVCCHTYALPTPHTAANNAAAPAAMREKMVAFFMIAAPPSHGYSAHRAAFFLPFSLSFFPRGQKRSGRCTLSGYTVAFLVILGSCFCMIYKENTICIFLFLKKGPEKTGPLSVTHF